MESTDRISRQAADKDAQEIINNAVETADWMTAKDAIATGIIATARLDDLEPEIERVAREVSDITGILVEDDERHLDYLLRVSRWMTRNWGGTMQGSSKVVPLPTPVSPFSDEKLRVVRVMVETLHEIVSMP